MAWELQIRSLDGSASLGSVAQVQAKLRGVFPKIELFRDASGAEKLAAMEERGIKVPETIREHWLGLKGAFQGVINGEDFTIEFHLGQDETTVAAVGIEVRGGGDPISVIEPLMNVEGWKVVDLQGEPPTRESWKSFGDWRDDGIRQAEDERV